VGAGSDAAVGIEGDDWKKLPFEDAIAQRGTQKHILTVPFP